MRITEEYIESVGEVDEILSYTNNDDFQKIPAKLRAFFKKIKSKEYVSHIEKQIPLKDQELKPKTKALLAFIYSKYLSSEKEKEEFDNRMRENDRKYKEAMENMYGQDIEQVFAENREREQGNRTKPI